MPLDMGINMSFQSIRNTIVRLPIDYYFKTLLLGDINLAIYYYGIQEIPNVRNYLSILRQRISAHIPQNIFLYDHVDLLLKNIDELRQALTAPSLPPESTEPPYSATLPNFISPESIEQDFIEPGPSQPEHDEPELVEQNAMEPEPDKPEFVESETIGPESSEPELVEPEAIEPESTQPEEAKIPVRAAGPEKSYLRWNFPVSPSKL